ncbi:54S ribosomal protein L39 [Mactra antiquata]
MLARKVCELCSRHGRTLHSKRKDFYSSASKKLTNAEIRKRRSALFTEEKNRQIELIKRLNKVPVSYYGHPEQDGPHKMLMNSHVSTPYHCAMHIDEYLTKRSIVATVNGEPWDMHKPFPENAVTLEFHHMLDEDPSLPNQAFWNTGSFVLGSVIDKSFKDNVLVQLYDTPKTKVEDGCFMYDVFMDIPDWKPSQMELQCLSREGGRLWIHELEFEPLTVGEDVAMKMFEDNPYKIKSLNSMLNESESDKLTLYRMGDYVDVSTGPLISNTSQLSRFSVTAVHQIDCPTNGKLYRFQALALPRDLKMHWWAWDFVCRRAAKQSKKKYPYRSTPENFFPNSETDSDREKVKKMTGSDLKNM